MDDALKTISYTAARQDLAETMQKVVDDHDPVIITRQKAGAVVMLSLEDFNAMQETMYLLGNPANAGRLRKSVADVAAGKTKILEIVFQGAKGIAMDIRKYKKSQDTIAMLRMLAESAAALEAGDYRSPTEVFNSARNIIRDIRAQKEVESDVGIVRP